MAAFSIFWFFFFFNKHPFINTCRHVHLVSQREYFVFCVTYVVAVVKDFENCALKRCTYQ